MKDKKPVITYLFAFLLFVAIFILSYRMVSDVEQPSVDTQPFSRALWDTWGMSMVIIAFISLAGGIGVLALLGGDWRWE